MKMRQLKFTVTVNLPADKFSEAELQAIKWGGLPVMAHFTLADALYCFQTPRLDVEAYVERKQAREGAHRTFEQECESVRRRCELAETIRLAVNENLECDIQELPDPDEED